jgi:hypothetical protein
VEEVVVDSNSFFCPDHHLCLGISVVVFAVVAAVAFVAVYFLTFFILCYNMQILK